MAQRPAGAGCQKEVEQSSEPHDCRGRRQTFSGDSANMPRWMAQARARRHQEGLPVANAESTAENTPSVSICCYTA